MAKYFRIEELACKCRRCAGQNNVGENGIDPKLLNLLDRIRERAGYPIYINSGYRCSEHNAEVGGVPDSQHVHGIAADIRSEMVSVRKLAQIAEEEGADGIGIYLEDGFVHVDVRGYTSRW